MKPLSRDNYFGREREKEERQAKRGRQEKEQI
jgi:hypothetical protein